MSAIRIKLPGVGDDYRWLGGNKIVINSMPAEVPAAPADRRAPRMAIMEYHGPDPGLEHERAMLGGLIVGEIDEATADRSVRCPAHRTIFAALAGEYIGSAEVAIQLCRAAGLPPELVGCIEADTALGYLAGCVRSWQAESERTAA